MVTLREARKKNPPQKIWPLSSQQNGLATNCQAIKALILPLKTFFSAIFFQILQQKKGFFLNGRPAAL